MKVVYFSMSALFILITQYFPCCHGNGLNRMTGLKIALQARKMIGSTKYPYTDSFWTSLTGDNYRGHLFVADVLKSVGVVYPKRSFPAKPIYADEWTNTSSDRFAVLSMCWRQCMGPAMSGDIIAYDGVVGIATAMNTIIYSSPVADPPGMIVEVPTKYVPDLKGTCWRVIC